MQSWRWGALLFLGAVACGSDNTTGSKGPPVLLQMLWTARHGATPSTVVWSADANQAVITTVTPFPFEFDLVFDRRLDGEKIEDIVVQDGMPYTVPKQMPPVTVTWEGMPAATADGPVRLSVAYNSLNLAGTAAGTSYVFGRAIPGYPSSTMLTFHWDRASLTSGDGQPMVGPDGVSFLTGPFTVQIPSAGSVVDGGAPPSVATDYRFPLSFSNRTAPEDAIKPFISLTVDGNAADFRVVIDENDRSSVYVAPPQLGTRWPAGATIEVAVRPGLPDVFGVTLTTGATATYVTSGVRPDGGVDSGTDGVVDGGADEVSDGGPVDSGDDDGGDAAADLN
jgi:hypothetical protein